MIANKVRSPRPVNIPMQDADSVFCPFLVTFTSGNAVIIQPAAKKLDGGKFFAVIAEEWLRDPSAEDRKDLHEDVDRFLRSLGLAPPNWDNEPPRRRTETARILADWLKAGKRTEQE